MSMKFKKKKIVILLTSLFVIITIILLFTFFFNDYRRQKRADLELLSSADYNSVFCAMYSIENFAQEDFVTYRGFNTLKLDNKLRKTADLSDYLEAAFASENIIETIYLGLDPAQIWDSCGHNPQTWSEHLNEDIFPYFSAHTDITFEILLPAPSLEYWADIESQEREALLSTYHSLICSLSSYHNVTTYFMGHEHWLIANPANYTDIQTTNEVISRKMMLFTFCDHQYQVNTETSSTYMEQLREQILQYNESQTAYPDLSSWDMVFFGDSILGNYVGSYSIPGVVAGLSGANTYNCGQGGTPASVDPNCVLSFPSAVDYFIAKDATCIPGDGPYKASMEQYLQDDHTGQNLCFVLNFGLNDYFGGHPVFNMENPHDNTTYAGALREGIAKLQEIYPDATIILMTPTYTTYFSNGTQPMSEKGGILTEYVEAALKIATETNVICMNNYVDSGINESTASTYLADGCHLNETGRFLMAELIIKQIEALTPTP